jgi:hypothetical protein
MFCLNLSQTYDMVQEVPAKILTAVVHINIDIHFIFLRAINPPTPRPKFTLCHLLCMHTRAYQNYPPQVATYTSTVFINSRHCVANIMQATNKHYIIPINNTFCNESKSRHCRDFAQIIRDTGICIGIIQIRVLYQICDTFPISLDFT